MTHLRFICVMVGLNKNFSQRNIADNTAQGRLQCQPGTHNGDTTNLHVNQRVNQRCAYDKKNKRETNLRSALSASIGLAATRGDVGGRMRQLGHRILEQHPHDSLRVKDKVVAFLAFIHKRDQTSKGSTEYMGNLITVSRSRMIVNRDLSCFVSGRTSTLAGRPSVSTNWVSSALAW